MPAQDRSGKAFGRRSLATGGIATLLAGESAAATRTPIGLGSTNVADEGMLRSRGARFDGTSDDLPVLQSVVDDATAAAPSGSIGRVAFELPACTILFSSALNTGRCHVSIRGAGQELTVLLMRPGGVGLVVHGSHQYPAMGTLQLANLSLVDGDPNGSGAICVSIQFAADAPQPCMAWDGVSLRHWTRPARIVNCPRNWHCESVALYGPDFTMQPGAGFEISSTADFIAGCFTYVFIDVLVVNYSWGWSYDIGAPLEGQRFISCTCYNGWGMVQVRVHSPTYHSLGWYVTDCDWQGLGYAFDLNRCRDVRIRGGYYVANLNPKQLVVSDGRKTRRLMEFIDCLGVELVGLRLDVLPGTEESFGLVRVDHACRDFRAFGTCIYALATIWAAFEFADANGPPAPTNTMGEFDTIFSNWIGGARARDAHGNQMTQSLLREAGIGDTGTDGTISIRGEQHATAESHSGTVTISIPKRPSGNPWFLHGNPYLSFSVQKPDGGPVGGLANAVTPSSFDVHIAAEGNPGDFLVRYQLCGR